MIIDQNVDEILMRLWKTSMWSYRFEQELPATFVIQKNLCKAKFRSLAAESFSTTLMMMVVMSLSGSTFFNTGQQPWIILESDINF